MSRVDVAYFAKLTSPLMKGVMVMKHYEGMAINRKDHRIMNVVGIFVRVLLTPILVWYRLYLWVWDGTMFNH